MLDKLHKLACRYDEISEMLSEPEIINNQPEYQKLSKELSKLEQPVVCYRQLKEIEQDLENSRQLLETESDKDMRQMIKEELESLERKFDEYSKEAQILLLPKDVRDEGGTIVEIRAGAGGDEAGLFAGDLCRMYRKYAERHNFKFNLLDSSPGLGNGFKEIVFEIEGEGAYRLFKYEGGTHRVQRVPETEAQGRVHTSTVTVAVLPQKTEISEVQLNPQDLKIDTFRAQGSGGQHVNTTDSAVRITHVPTGIVVACQEERSQFKNKAKAMQYLKAKLYDEQLSKQLQTESSIRKQMVGSGERSEKIRTYNFPQGRISDHRIKLTIYRLEEVLQSGDLDDIVDGLLMQEQLNKLQALHQE